MGMCASQEELLEGERPQRQERTQSRRRLSFFDSQRELIQSRGELQRTSRVAIFSRLCSPDCRHCSPPTPHQIVIIFLLVVFAISTAMVIWPSDYVLKLLRSTGD